MYFSFSWDQTHNGRSNEVYIYFPIIIYNLETDDDRYMYRMFRKNCVFSKNFHYFPPLPRKHWAAIGCTEIGQPIGVTVNLRCVESFGNVETS